MHNEQSTRFNEKGTDFEEKIKYVYVLNIPFVKKNFYDMYFFIKFVIIKL